MRKSTKHAFTVAGVATGAASMALLGLGAVAPQVAGAQTTGAKTYMATLTPVPVNGQTSASGTLKLVLTGSKATITEHTQGLAKTFTGKPYPHLQHIHGLATGKCPGATVAKTGVISTTDATPVYGKIMTALTVTPGGTTGEVATGKTTTAKTPFTVNIAPTGTGYTYSRTVTLTATAVKAITGGTAVIVVHGLTPSTAPKAASTLKSPAPDTTLPLAASAPALCGPLVASQMSSVPSGAPQTGGGSTAGFQDASILAVGGGMIVAGGGLLFMRRRRSAS